MLKFFCLSPFIFLLDLGSTKHRSMEALDDVLPFILQAYCKPTEVQMPAEYTATRGVMVDCPTLLGRSLSIAQDAGFVSKKWRLTALAAQRSDVQGMRVAFFAEVAELA